MQQSNTPTHRVSQADIFVIPPRPTWAPLGAWETLSDVQRAECRHRARQLRAWGAAMLFGLGSRPIAGSAGESIFTSRGLTAPSAFRFRASLSGGPRGERRPAIIAPMQPIDGGAVTLVARAFLDATLTRITHSDLHGWSDEAAVVRIGDTESAEELVIGLDILDAAALGHALKTPAVALVNATFARRFELPDRVRRVVIADHQRRSSVLLRLAQTLSAQHREVEMVASAHVPRGGQ